MSSIMSNLEDLETAYYAAIVDAPLPQRVDRRYQARRPDFITRYARDNNLCRASVQHWVTAIRRIPGDVREVLSAMTPEPSFRTIERLSLLPHDAQRALVADRSSDSALVLGMGGRVYGHEQRVAATKKAWETRRSACGLMNGAIATRRGAL